jgi:hypothetical protein
MDEIDLRYCPTNNMWVDILTKPLQGSKFHQLQAVLMNCSVDYSKNHPLVLSYLFLLFQHNMLYRKLGKVDQL